MLYETHQQIVQEKQLSNMLKGEIQRQKDNLDQSIRQTISASRNFGLFDIWYPRLSEGVVQQFLLSPIYTREKKQPYDSPSSLPYNSSITTKINNFMKNYQQYIPLLVKCANQYFMTSQGTLKYIPCNSPIQFFASSSFLSLFGYCWCVEQGAACVDALCLMLKIQIKHCVTISSVSFRNSYIRDIIRQFMHTTGVQKYLQLSLSTIYTDFLYDEVFTKLNPNSAEYYAELLKYVGKFTNRLIEYLPFMPSILRYFFHKAFLTAKEMFPEDSTEPNLLVEIFFFDLLLQPAMLNPKLFALIPETSVVPRSTQITSLTRIFRWATSEQSIPDRYKEIGFHTTPAFTELRVSELLRLLSDYNDDVDGIFSARLQNVSDMRFHLLLLSVNDVLFWCTIINQTIDKITDEDPKNIEKLKQFTSVANDFTLNSGELIDFWFMAFKLPTQPFKPSDLKEPAKLYLPILPPCAEELPQDEVSGVIEHVITYLEGLRPSQQAPTSLREFLQYQLSKATEKGSSELITKTQAVTNKLAKLGVTDEEILQRVRTTVFKRTERHRKEFASSFLQQEACANMEAVKRSIRLMSEQLTPIINQSLLRLFLVRNKSVQPAVAQRQGAFCSRVDQWLDFFVPQAGNLTTFAEQCGLDASQKMPLIRQLHSTLISEIPYAAFLRENAELPALDRAVDARYDAALEAFMKEEYSPVLQTLFKAPETFEPAMMVLRRGTSFGAPLERLQQIMAAMDVLQDIYMFEAGEGCPGDDFFPLFIYCLIRTRIPNLASVLAYTVHFLLSAEGRVKLLDSKENYCATTWRTAAEHLIDEAKRTL